MDQSQIFEKYLQVHEFHPQIQSMMSKQSTSEFLNTATDSPLAKTTSTIGPRKLFDLNKNLSEGISS